MATETTGGPALLNVEGAAAVLRISPGLARRLIKDGSIPSFRLGKLIKIRSTDLDHLVAGTAAGQAGGVATP